jgi:hypothetical protein
MSCVDCGKGCAKFFLILFNVIFFCAGAVLFAVAIWVRVDEDVWDKITFIELDSSDPYLEYGAYLVIAIGAFIMVTCLIGFIGAIKESRCLLIIYMVVIFIAIAAEIAAAALFLIYQEDIKDKAMTELDKKFQADKTKTERTNFFQLLREFEVEFECCGLDTAGAEYTGASDEVADCIKPDGTNIPCSCCGDEDQSANCNTTLYTEGCYESLEDAFDEYAIILVGLVIGFGCIEIFGFIFAVCLCVNADKNKYVS